MTDFKMTDEQKKEVSNSNRPLYIKRDRSLTSNPEELVFSKEYREFVERKKCLISK
jgi:hypothetical protein